MFSGNKKVLYYHDDVIGTYQYATGHPMKPLRVAMTNELVKSYGLYDKLDVYDNDFCDTHLKDDIDQVMTKFHSDDYIELIKQVTPENKHLFGDQIYRCNYQKFIKYI
jgi:histone deacetylase 1/2